MRGRSSRVPDPTADRLRLTAEAEREAEQRQAAAAELALAGALHGATISPAARDLLLYPGGRPAGAAGRAGCRP